MEVEILVIAETTPSGAQSTCPTTMMATSAENKHLPVNVMIVVRNNLLVDEVLLKSPYSKIVCAGLKILKVNPLYTLAYYS